MNETELTEIYKKLCHAKASKFSNEDILELSRAAGEICGNNSAFTEAIKDIVNMNAFNSAFNNAFEKSQQLTQSIQNPKETVDRETKKQKVSFEKPSGPVKQFCHKTDFENNQ